MGSAAGHPDGQRPRGLPHLIAGSCGRGEKRDGNDGDEQQDAPEARKTADCGPDGPGFVQFVNALAGLFLGG